MIDEPRDPNPETPEAEVPAEAALRLTTWQLLGPNEHRTLPLRHRP